MTRFHYGHGAALALVAAGPSFMLLLLVGQLLYDPTGTDLTELLALLPVLLIATVVGMVISLLPVLLGGLAMGYLGVLSVGARHPVLWAAAGAGLGALMGFAFDSARTSWLVLPFLLNGAICALIVRYGTRWSDDSV